MNGMSDAFLDATLDFDESTAAAWRFGLQTMFQRLEQWGPRCGRRRIRSHAFTDGSMFRVRPWTRLESFASLLS